MGRLFHVWNDVIVLAHSKYFMESVKRIERAQCTDSHTGAWYSYQTYHFLMIYGRASLTVSLNLLKY
jgi:hypothetical protein